MDGSSELLTFGANRQFLEELALGPTLKNGNRGLPHRQESV